MANTIATAYVQIEPSFNGVANKLKTGLGDESKSAGESAGKSFGSGFGSVMGTSAKVIAGAVAAGTAAVTGLVKQSIDSYGNYEQLAGGVETLFGRSEEEIEAMRQSMLKSGMSAAQVTEEIANMSDASDIVMKNAANAYKTAGMSANEYMETVTSFSASLLQSLGGDTEKAANTADMAIADMSDNANKMGTDISSIQTAYQGFAKQNYTMLDNLKLGYGGTKAEMERLLQDASKISGIKYDISSLDDVYNAIHVVQTEMGITGTTALEASTTIQGSLGQLQASWENVLTGMGDKNADMGSLIDTLVQNAETFIGNILPIIEQSLTGISTLIAQVAPVIAEKIPGLLQSVLPMLLTSGVQIVDSLAQGLLSAIPTLMPTITELVISLMTMIVEMLPQMIEVGAQVLLSLATGIANALPALIPTIVNVLIQIVQTLIENVPLLIDAAVQLILGLVDGLLAALPILIDQIPTIIEAIITALVTSIPLLINGAMQLINGIVASLPDIITALIDALPMIIDAIVTGLISNLPMLIAGAIQLVISLVAALPQIILALVNAMPIILDTLVKALIQAAPKLLDAAKQMITTLKNGWNQFFPTLITAALNLFTGLKTAILNFVKSFVDVGKQIIEGIKKGISDAWEGLKSWFSEKLKGLVDGVVDFFKIGSPSKLMADEVGRWIPAGIAEGIQEGMDELDNTVKSMTEGIMSASIDPSYASTYTSNMVSENGNDLTVLIQLLRQYLPAIAENDNVNITLDGDAGRLFRLMQRESMKNTELVGVNSVLSAI